ncbi:MAG: hypothetical protein AAF532_16515 [Planctomycetota bacterium]
MKWITRNPPCQRKPKALTSYIEIVRQARLFHAHAISLARVFAEQLGERRVGLDVAVTTPNVDSLSASGRESPDAGRSSVNAAVAIAKSPKIATVLFIATLPSAY